MNNIERVYSTEVPLPMVRGDKHGNNIYDIRINFNVQQLEEPDEQGNTLMYDTMQIKQGQYYYGGIVSAIINAKYSNDEMWAIVNNHLLERSSDTEEEYQQMQQWRLFAKQMAKEILGINNE